MSPTRVSTYRDEWILEGSGPIIGRYPIGSMYGDWCLGSSTLVSLGIHPVLYMNVWILEGRLPGSMYAMVPRY